jgi:hypothetical protein
VSTKKKGSEVMKKLWLLLAIAVPLQSIHSQEVQPTVEQCRADQKLWTARELFKQDLSTEYFFPEKRDETKTSHNELTNRVKEMFDCSKVDPDNERTYYDAMSGICAARAMRLKNFLVRHNLWNQFIAEDAQGKRGPRL